MDSAADEAPKTLLITLSGKDRPGVTSSIFATLTGAGVEVLDIEQIVLRRRLILGVLVTAPRDWKKLRSAVEKTAWRSPAGSAGRRIGGNCRSSPSPPTLSTRIARMRSPPDAIAICRNRSTGDSSNAP